MERIIPHRDVTKIKGHAQPSATQQVFSGYRLLLLQEKYIWLHAQPGTLHREAFTFLKYIYFCL